MSLVIQKTGAFKQDFARQFGWYVEESGPDVARRFQMALDTTLHKVAQWPALGRARRFTHPHPPVIVWSSPRPSVSGREVLAVGCSVLRSPVSVSVMKTSHSRYTRQSPSR
ncbi:MAG: type II toxin-antitoxin system RelE/ParE family toxin [Verrucomicrobia bacterium]|jgi:plasmid stabilization system protein ParE|nr:type II toxin-antitoxin system RelE/ParE family toxin [Verrucomicrobiota bacterium]